MCFIINVLRCAFIIFECLTKDCITEVTIFFLYKEGIIITVCLFNIYFGISFILMIDVFKIINISLCLI